MPKRGSENSQMKKEDYEAMMAQDSGGDDGKGFEKAAPDVLNQRSRVTAKRAPRSTPAAAPAPAAGSSSNPFASFSFSAAAPAPATPSAMTPVATPANMASTEGAPLSGQEKLVKRYQDQACAFIDSFAKTCKEINPQTTYMLPIVDHVLDALYVVEDQYWKHSKKDEDDKSPATTSKDFGIASPAPNLFGAAAPAPSPKAFRFGSTNAPNAGDGMTTAFGGGTPAPAPPSSGANEAGDAPLDENIHAVMADTDPDWKLLETIPKVPVYTIDKQGKYEKKFKGDLKLQEHKENKKKRMIIWNNVTGKVLLNSVFPQSMAFASTPDKSDPSMVTHEAHFVGKITAEHEAGVITLSRKGPQTLKSLEDVFTGLGVQKLVIKARV
ncbi:expressed unknown protein [Seminavis robusta]|uniref:Nuclear pore complex NUP2/50/61 domain-containing protein n=1 Tax=Seminavis robusta TaxID=568900 RepID=A0A9N8ETK9_9STRA|nr:expressed unknown protein [Seminavis robusta]|eukprot:Sro1837_g300710.1 n/a (382) ;mRNA; f:3219-4364